jgi:nicotinate-nucleotide adenylyltransferase
VRLIPLRQAVHRAQPAAPPELRLAMLKAATEDSDRLVVDDRELHRPGPSFTVDTLRSLHAEFAGTALCLLLGEDAFAGLPGWHEPDAILDLASIAVLQRPGHELPGDPALAALMQQRRVDHLTPGRNGEIVTCEVTQLEIASSDLRRRVAAGRSIDYLVPPAVARLVRQNALYR